VDVRQFPKVRVNRKGAFEMFLARLINIAALLLALAFFALALTN